MTGGKKIWKRQIKYWCVDAKFCELEMKKEKKAEQKVTERGEMVEEEASWYYLVWKKDEISSNWSWIWVSIEFFRVIKYKSRHSVRIKPILLSDSWLVNLKKDNGQCPRTATFKYCNAISFSTFNPTFFLYYISFLFIPFTCHISFSWECQVID